MAPIGNTRAASMIPWLVVVAVAAVAGGLIFKLKSTNDAQQQELTALREDKKELESLKVEAKDLPQLRAMAREFETVKKDAEAVHRLRGEVSQLRAEQQQFVKTQGEVQRLQGALQQQQTQTEQLRAQQAQMQAAAASQQAAQTTSQNSAALQAAQVGALQNACLNNLRQLDGATQQWALENRITAGLRVNPEGIKAYLRGGVLPICPAGGQYSVTIVGEPPRCSIPGHSLK